MHLYYFPLFFFSEKHKPYSKINQWCGITNMSHSDYLRLPRCCGLGFLKPQWQLQLDQLSLSVIPHRSGYWYFTTDFSDLKENFSGENMRLWSHHCGIAQTKQLPRWALWENPATVSISEAWISCLEWKFCHQPAYSGMHGDELH